MHIHLCVFPNYIQYFNASILLPRDMGEVKINVRLKGIPTSMTTKMTTNSLPPKYLI